MLLPRAASQPAPGHALARPRWLFGSSTSHKAWLLDADPAKAPVSAERQRLLEDQQRDEAHRERLAPLWEAMRGPAEAFQRGFIAKRLY
jgi:hypothetical protein